MAKKAFYFLRTCVEEYLPMITFSVMFLAFILQIFARYVLRVPQTWVYEVTVTCYLWTVMFGACYTTRMKDHVQFTLLYDRLKPRGKAILVFLGDLIILVAFIIMIPSTIKFIGQMKMQVTAVFKIGLNIVYFPYIPFMFIIIAYMLTDMYECFMVFTGLGGQAAVDRMLRENKNEVQLAVEAAEAAEKEGEEHG